MNPADTNEPGNLPDFLQTAPDKRLLGKSRRWWALLAAAAVLIVGLFLLLPGGGAPQGQYLTEEAQTGNLLVTISASGTLQPTRSVDVGSELSGILEAVLVNENDRVRKGQVVARLDPSKLQDQVTKSRAAVAAAEAAVALSEATVAESRANLGRLRHVAELSGGKVPAKSELETAEATYQRAVASVGSAQAAVVQARATLKSDETNIEKAVIRAPINGVVLSRKVEPGQTLVAAMTAPVLFSIAEDLTKMELQVKVDEADVGSVKLGQSASFSVAAWAGRSFPATILRVGIGSTITDNVVTYKTVLGVANDDLALRPGMTATARIVTANRQQVLLVPNAALRYTPPATNAAGSGLPAAAAPAAVEAAGQGRHDRGAAGVGSARRAAVRHPGARRREQWPPDGNRRRRVEARHGGDHRLSGNAKVSEAAALISLRGVTKTYGVGPAAFQALRGVDLDIAEGEFVAIMGPSGSGKSTALNVLGCLDAPTAGRYAFRGVRVESLDRNQRALLRRHYLGFVFQGFNLLARTSAQENVELPLLYRGDEASRRHQASRAALAKVGLAGWERHTPAELSGGQQQRVAIARAIVTAPLVLLADEPTGNLDSQRSHDIMALLVALNQEQGITVIMVTHEAEMADYARRTVRFVDGRVDSDRCRVAA
jgi:HlyD family secretion protein